MSSQCTLVKLTHTNSSAAAYHSLDYCYHHDCYTDVNAMILFFLVLAHSNLHQSRGNLSAKVIQLDILVQSMPEAITPLRNSYLIGLILHNKVPGCEVFGQSIVTLHPVVVNIVKHVTHSLLYYLCAQHKDSQMVVLNYQASILLQFPATSSLQTHGKPHIPLD